MSDLTSDERACKHELLSDPPFDHVAASGLSAHEVRKRWPRADDKCPTCGVRVIRYASMLHYVAGDW